MQLIAKKVLHFTLSAAALGFVAACTTNGSFAQTVTVAIWRGGDDGLTVRLSDAIETAFRSSTSFSISNTKQSGALLVTIPTNVPWKQVGDQTQVLYTVEFTSGDGRKLGTSEGSCWADALAECATHVVKDAQIATAKIH